MKRSEQVANELFPRHIDEPESFAEAVGRQAVIDGYEQAKEDMIELSANWIYDNFWKYGNRNDLVEAFRKEMK